MKRLTTLLIGCLMIATAQSQSHIAEIGMGSCGIGQMVAIPIYATQWNDMEAITIHIAFDEGQLEFIGCDFHPAFMQNMIYACHNGVIGMAWYQEWMPLPSISYGKFATMYFIQWGSSPLTFVPINEWITTPYIPVQMTMINGGVPLPPRAFAKETVN